MKNCTNCGTQIADDLQICPVCGAVQAQQGFNPPPMQQGFGQAAPYGMPVKKNNTPLIIGIVVALIAVVAIVLVVVLTKGGKGKGGSSGASAEYKKVAESYLSAACKGEGETAAKCCIEPAREEVTTQVNLIKMVYAFAGTEVKISYKISDYEKLSKDEIDELTGILEDDYDYNCSISEAYYASYTTTVEANGESEKNESKMIVAKIDGKWYVAYGW